MPFAVLDGAIRAMALFPEGNRLLVGGDGPVVRTLDRGSGAVLGSMATPTAGLLAAGATFDGRLVLCGTEAITVLRLGAPPSHVPVPEWPSVTAAAVSALGNTLVAHRTHELRVWRFDESGRFTAADTMDIGFAVRAVEVTVDGDRIVVGGHDPVVRILRWTGEVVRELPGHRQDVVSVATTPDCAWTATLDRDRVPRLWHTADARPEPVELTGHDGELLKVALSPDGGTVVAGDLGGTIWVWQRNVPGVAKPLSGHGVPVTAFAPLPDNLRLVSGAQDGTVRIWDLAGLAEIDVRMPRKLRPELVSDRESAEDLLGFADDVDGVATLIADRNTELPMAIALLGQWGSGKSSFMRQLQNRVTDLAEQSRRNPARSVFANAVRQVRFNAWHYADDHLWVGLLDHLFAELAKPETEPDARQVRAERDSLRAKVRKLAELNDKAGANGQVLKLPRLIWSAGGPILSSWRGRIGLGVLTVLAATTVTVVALDVDRAIAVLGVVTTALTGLMVLAGQLAAGWRVVRGFADRRRDALRAELRDARVRLARLDAAEQLDRLVTEARSGGYDQYRGLVSRAHEDLRGLSDIAQAALAEWNAEDADRDRPPPLERIVLYIDDLDRCPPRKVVDVLAAVHLLLALPLFVVVVAVDPRWLRHCLDQHHLDLFGGRTPADYLDKIFQVVFALRPMGASASSYIDAMVPVDHPDSDSGADWTPRRRQGTTSTPDGNHLRTAPPAEHFRLMIEKPPAPQPDPLRLREVERETIKRLRPLLDTPRAIKRLVNLYRLVRAGVPHEELDAYIGNGTGPFLIDLVLLAISVSAPSCARTLLSALLDSENSDDITRLAERFAAEESDQEIWQRLFVVLRREITMHGNLATYRERAGTIARFSFETWDLTTPDDKAGLGRGASGAG